MLNTRPALMKASLGLGESTAPSSNTSPVRISLAARSTVAGFIMLPEPRWSSAPHFDGQRSLSGGICQDCAWANDAPRPIVAAIEIKAVRFRMVPSLQIYCGLMPAATANALFDAT